MRQIGNLWKQSSVNRRVVIVVVGALAALMGMTLVCSVCAVVMGGGGSRTTPAPTRARVAAGSTSTPTPQAVATVSPGGTTAPSSTPAPTNTPAPTYTRAPTATPTTTPTHLELLRAAIANALGDSNRKEPRIEQISVNADKQILVRFAIEDSLVTSWIVDGAKDDVAAVLKAVAQSGMSYTSVKVEGTFPMRDKFGNVSEDVVIRAVYTRETVARINWGGFRAKDVLDIADMVYAHPQFR